ncbi:MAG: YjbH domain-containing protein [Alphaproteobacteria bacterium]|nr:YjbH domain-containing protein [Alphaproteobacteria bacterium]
MIFFNAKPSSRTKRRCAALIFAATLLCPHDNVRAAEPKYSPFLLGPLGLNTIPSARMDAPGTIRAGISTSDPYLHGFLNIQIASPLSLTLRQSAQTSSLRAEPDKLSPGMDIKLKLLEETAHRPAIALGLQSIIGDHTLAGQYIALSKRYKNIDLTLGTGRRVYSGNHKYGIFGGAEYFTPLDNLSIKIDYNPNTYAAERSAIPDFNRPAPWSASLNYTYGPAAASLGLQGTDKIMARLSLQASPENWPLKSKKYETPAPFYKTRPGVSKVTTLKTDAEEENIALSGIHEENQTIHATINLNPNSPAPQQLGRAARHLAAHSGPDTEEIELSTTILGLQGPQTRLLRTDLERALSQKQGSPEELWANTEFTSDHKAEKTEDKASRFKNFHLELDNTFSLAETDSGLLYRTSLIAGHKTSGTLGFLNTGTAFRLNLADNLSRLDTLRSPAFWPVRSDIDDFTRQRLTLENSYINAMHTLSPGLYASASAGYLEEMYAGIGGEILYRPFKSRLTLGGEIWEAFRRNPDTAMHTGLNGDHVLTGHISAWYDLPGEDITLGLKAGRYLAEDIGGTLSLEKTFKNGARLSASATMTNGGDIDIYGHRSNIWNGFRLSLPLGSLRYVPENTHLNIAAEPFGRDTGQSLKPPLPLRAATENFTLNHMSKNWNEILN